MSQAAALSAFAGFGGKVQSAGHIKPLHWYVACRLVLEGGFDPADVTPRPPFRVDRRQGGAAVLHYDESVAGGGERTILGGLKTKNVDIVVTRDGIGPVLAVSCKGVTAAFRNLTNRLEETIGECTNLHITYPALVLGYLVMIRANKEEAAPLDMEQEALLNLVAEATESSGDIESPSRVLAVNDIALTNGGEPVAAIMRFHNALRELVGRRGIRDDVSRYESIALGLVDMEQSARGALVAAYPSDESPLHVERFFSTLYLRYDERFVTSAPDIASVTRRAEWSAGSVTLDDLPGLDYEVRWDTGRRP